MFFTSPSQPTISTAFLAGRHTDRSRQRATANTNNNRCVSFPCLSTALSTRSSPRAQRTVRRNARRNVRRIRGECGCGTTQKPKSVHTPGDETRPRHAQLLSTFPAQLHLHRHRMFLSLAGHPCGCRVLTCVCFCRREACTPVRALIPRVNQLRARSDVFAHPPRLTTPARWRTDGRSTHASRSSTRRSATPDAKVHQGGRTTTPSFRPPRIS